MKFRSSVSLMLVLLFCVPIAAQEMSDAARLALYQDSKKNPMTAGLLSCCVSSTGHLYADNWGRGLKFTAGRAACVVMMISLGFDEVTTEGSYYTTTTLEPNGIYTLGSIANLGLAIWEIYDSVDITKKYNKNLYRKIYGVDPPFDLGMRLVPLHDGLAINIAANF